MPATKSTWPTSVTHEIESTHAVISTTSVCPRNPRGFNPIHLQRMVHWSRKLADSGNHRFTERSTACFACYSILDVTRSDQCHNVQGKVFCGLFATVLKAVIRTRHQSHHLVLALDRNALALAPFLGFLGLGVRIMMLRTSLQGLGVLCFVVVLGMDSGVCSSFR
jgi:hypothetical protein